ncbi:hypothetical protein ACFO1B_04980 [Dactylosporangium siamense]|uniref:Uncharacterized protein n=1 Tax=Dactylosporangium siamense TaxID=685454 RepID=A0A919PIC7_9ACTN|nr:hypothetical protein [Dactylosporangium siamense]GIG42758.1 hypothetical protein Dsi01nite_007990 [Dactylosporangium siamense]
MKRLAVLLALLVVLAGGAVALRGPIYRLACPETVTNYGQMPRPAVPLVRSRYFAQVGDGFAVGGHRDPMPSGRPRVEGDASAVRYVRAETSPTGERCGTVVAGYRYHIYVAEHAGDVVIDGYQIQIAARP